MFLDASDIKTTRPSQKLAHQFLGPYPVLAKVRRHTYKLGLPPSMSRLHPVFNVVKLLPAPDDPIPGRQADPLPPDLIDGEEHFELEAILDSHFQRNRLEYLIKWKGYGYEHNSWVLERDMVAQDLVAKFHRDHPSAPRRIRHTAFQSLTFCQLRSLPHAPRTSHPKGGVMSGDQQFRPLESLAKAPPRTSSSSLRDLSPSVNRPELSVQTCEVTSACEHLDPRS